MVHHHLDTMDPLRGPGLVSVDNTIHSVDGVLITRIWLTMLEFTLCLASTLASISNYFIS